MISPKDNRATIFKKEEVLNWVGHKKREADAWGASVRFNRDYYPNEKTEAHKMDRMVLGGYAVDLSEIERATEGLIPRNLTLEHRKKAIEIFLSHLKEE